LRQRLSSTRKFLVGVKHHTHVKATWKVEEDHMVQFVGVDCALYAHSPVHTAVARRDHATMCHILSTLPPPARVGEVNLEAQSIEAE
jgi:hypothetical protein